MKLYNTLTKEIEELKPVKEGEIGIYSCGPTVYWNQHIGNMYCYVQWDILVRYLRFSGYKVRWVMNITDVGHNVSDEDTGEDKMEKGAKREVMTVWDIADKYIGQFLESMSLLNIQKPDVLCRATDHIKEQIDIIKKIESGGFTYKTKTGLVFDTSKFPDYPKFARLNLEKQEAGARVEVDPEKKSPWDFLLWVTNQPNHIMQWDSPWGRGFPGWHIECTAMSVKYLGETFDIHTGGKEHIPVHHTNEIAQGFGAFGHKTANFWLHNEWLTLKDAKMSKSLGNVYTVQDLIKMGFDPLALRYLIMTSHYHQGLVFSLESLKSAQKALHNLKELVLASKDQKGRTVLSQEKEKKVQEYIGKFNAFLDNDLGVAQALAVLWEALKSNIPSEDKYDLAISFDEVLGLNLRNIESSELKTIKTPNKGFTVFSRVNLNESTIIRIEEREYLRKQGKFEEADKKRIEINIIDNIEIKDTPQGMFVSLFDKVNEN